jgi:hypothetical protein
LRLGRNFGIDVTNQGMAKNVEKHVHEICHKPKFMALKRSAWLS